MVGAEHRVWQGQARMTRALVVSGDESGEGSSLAVVHTHCSELWRSRTYPRGARPQPHCP